MPQTSTEQELFTLTHWFSSSFAALATPLLQSRAGTQKDGSCEQHGGNESQRENGGRRATLITTRSQQWPQQAHERSPRCMA